MLTIGRFAGLTGLSAHALRHYDEVGLLVPAVVDEQSRYRRYRRDQAGRARLIAALRCNATRDAIDQAFNGRPRDGSQTPVNTPLIGPTRREQGFRAEDVDFVD